ncbi:MAG: recombination regulator RecX [Aquiluna sp.]|jgi:regulatory protein|uniref:regulatory protein RecX n=1 Tax=Aquiluna sp. TaxID=2053504 RepID=UPI000112D1F9|nr:recombination regulator RecX [Aquiluna sp.]MDP4887186.1 recombination regulator RecX [Aquiluna sp.]
MAKSENEKLEQRAKNVLLHQLSRSMKTRFQLQEILKKREIPDEIAQLALDRFTEAQLIDDAVFAAAYVRTRLENGRSVSAIRGELRRKGVAQELIEAELVGVDSDREQEIANKLAANRYSRMLNLEAEVRKRRLLGFLQRRGFSQSIAYRAISNAASQG